MKVPLLQRIADGFKGDVSAELRVRIFRLICGMTFTLCLLVVAPLNFMQELPLGVHVSNIVLGLSAAIFYWQSCRGRHLYFLFLALIVGMLDYVFFLNAGIDGSIGAYFFPVLVFVMTMFEGWTRRVLVFGLWMNVALLFLLGHLYPEWVTPFADPLDRLIDVETSYICCFLALGAVLWFVLLNYRREQQLLTETATRLVTSEAHYREIFNSTSDALVVYAPDGRIMDANDQACALFQADRKVFVGRSVGDLSSGEPPYTSKEILEYLHQAQQGNTQVFEWRSRRFNGELFWSEVALRVWAVNGEQRVIASIRDITQRKQTQEKILLNEERTRLALWASNQSWFEVNLKTGKTLTSPEYALMLGYDPNNFVSNLEVWMDRLHPDDRPEVLRIFRASQASGEIGAHEYRLRTASGGWKWVRSVGKVVESDAAGRPVRVLGTHMDITERKELENQLLHSQRLEAVGTLASGVAHDLNNILTPMLMASGILRDKLADAKDRELMSLLDDGGRRGAAIVRQLLAFSRNLAQDRVALDPRPLLKGMVQLMRATFPKEIKIVEEIPEGHELVEAESNQLHQVFMNLCVNARDAMPSGGTLTLAMERLELPTASIAGHGPHLVFSVADTGHGIPDEIIDRIFDPFFTTKSQGKGTGLGLASVHGIIKSHHGFVRLETRVGQGTVFRVYLPVLLGSIDGKARPAPVAKPAPPSRPERPKGRGSVLVVDDDPGVLSVTGRLLQTEGYQVFTSTNGSEGLQILREKRAEIDLVITDFSMPDMDGPTLAVELRKIAPALKIIGVSGLNHQHRMDELKAIGFCEVLNKPYEMDVLLQVVRRHMISSANGS